MLSPKDGAINTGGELPRAVQQRPPGHVRACRYKADRKLREIVNDDHKRKLDQLEQRAAPELHGNLNGATPPRPRAPQNLRSSLIASAGGERSASGKPRDVPSVPGIVPAFLRIKVGWSSRG